MIQFDFSIKGNNSNNTRNHINIIMVNIHYTPIKPPKKRTTVWYTHLFDGFSRHSHGQKVMNHKWEEKSNRKSSLTNQPRIAKKMSIKVFLEEKNVIHGVNFFKWIKVKNPCVLFLLENSDNRTYRTASKFYPCRKDIDVLVLIF